jgi:hypothetical protein
MTSVGNVDRGWCLAAPKAEPRWKAEASLQQIAAFEPEPELKPTPNPFRPRPAPEMRQVWVQVHGEVFGKFEYLFDTVLSTFGLQV